MDDNTTTSDLGEDDEDNSVFQQAAEYVQTQTIKDGGKQLEQKKLLGLYGFYKVATVGKCTDPKPGLFDLRGKAKWAAWTQVSNLSKDAAVKGYIDCVKEFYNWTPPSYPLKDSSSKSSCGGNSVSIMLKPDEVDDDLEETNTIFSWAKDNSLKSIHSWLKEGNDPNVQDRDGLSPLHWAVDRGHYDACILLLNSGAHLNIKDSDGQTPMDYAVTCEYEQIVSLLEERHVQTD